MLGSVILQGLKKAVKLIGKKVSATALKVSNSWVGRKVASGVKKFGARMAKNVRSKRWWGRAVRTLRSSRSMLGTVGRIGTALKKSGGLLGLFGRGLSIFDTDYRSPKEFRKEIKAKEKFVKNLKNKRAQLIKEEQEAQKNLTAPIVTEGIETPEAKIDELSKHLSLMKESLSVIRANSVSASLNIKGFESYQVKANERLSEAIDYGTQTNMKTVAAGLEDVKDVNKAVAASSAESIIGEITSKIDEIEESKKREAEFRRKNDWKKKLLNFTLFVADWILNWPFKLAMLGLKVAAFITGALALFYIKNIVPIKSLIKAGPLTVINFIGSKLVQFGSWLWSKIFGIINWIYKKLIGIMFSIPKWIGKLLSKVPLIGKYAKKGVEKLNEIETSIKKTSDEIKNTIVGGLEALNKASKKNAEEVLAKAKSKYLAEAKAKEEKNKNNYQALNSESPDEVSERMISQGTSSTEAKAKETSTKEEDDKSFSKDSKSSMPKTPGGVMDATAQMLEEKDVEGKIVSTKEKMSSLYMSGKNSIIKATKSIKESDHMKKLEEKSTEKIEQVREAVSQLGEVVKESVAHNSSGKEGAMIAKGSEKINFEESANNYKARM